ncbi:MAG: ribosome-associated translation inhibitor RaiA [Mucispirillum sp.]|nr:ribosome-associated translation inhibitor RaiA [Mucispirillum sp.]
MNIIVNAKHTTLTDAIRDYSEKKIQRIAKYFDDNMDVHVNLNVEKNMHIAEIFVNVKGMFLKGIERSEDMYASIDMAADKIERQVVKYKEKLISRKNIENRESMENLKLSVYDYDEDSAIDEPTVVISKQIPAKPMDIEEAIMQMDLMNRNFFVFRNAENSEINVVYKRDDGKVGIIEP